jgi:hypothetical protein
MQVGPFAVAVTEVPGRSLCDHEWQDILGARRSYPAMWGGTGADIFANDPQDGRDTSPYETRHYLAWIRDGRGPCKLVTMRKVTVVPSRLTARERANPFDFLPLDIQLWRVRTEAGRSVPLWEVLRAHARCLAPGDELAEFRIAALGRTGTHPHGERQRTARERERTGIAFAAIQLLATYGDPSLLYICSLCPEFQDRVLAVVGTDGVNVPPAFTRTEEVLGLPPGSVGLDSSRPVVQEHKAAFPGYFLDNDDAARIVAGLLDDGRVTEGDLGAPILRLVEHESAKGGQGHRLDELVALIAARDHRALARMLTRPHLFKNLIPLMEPGRPLASLLCETGDGPFSSTLVPGRWRSSAWAVLEAAEEKYEGAEVRAPETRPAPTGVPGAPRRWTAHGRPWSVPSRTTGVPARRSASDGTVPTIQPVPIAG